MTRIGLAVMLLGMPLMAHGTGHKAAGLRVVKAFLDKDKQVHLQWTGRPEQVMERDHSAEVCDDMDKRPCTEVAASQLLVSADRRSVGWLAEFNTCCQSYPIPMVLVLARAGRVIQRFQVGGTYDWQFVNQGWRVALFSDTAHGPARPECVLYDVRTGKRIARWSWDKGRPLPIWAKEFAKDIDPS